MRIIKQSEFVHLPAGVFYMHYDPCAFGELRIKGETLSDNDWWYASTSTVDGVSEDDVVEQLQMMEDWGRQVDLDFEIECRNAAYASGDSLIAVLDKTDISALMGRLTLAYRATPK